MKHDAIGLAPVPTEDFVQYLCWEYSGRCAKNPRYSLRAFAKGLKISHASLSSIIRGRRPLTKKTRERLALALGLGPNEIARFEGRLSSGVTFDLMKPEVFSSLSEWYHDAILELVKVGGFVGDPRWIARRLGITATQASIAFTRLKTLGLLIRAKNGWDTPAVATTNILEAGYTDAAGRSLQKQLLEKSIVAIDAVDISARDHTSLCLAFDSRDIVLVREKIRNLRREIDDLSRRRGVKLDQVYQLILSFFPLTQTETTERRSS